MSIQKYIYASNKLKENIGASSIIEGLFNQYKYKNNGKYNICFEKALENGYEAGGNAILVFDDDKDTVAETLKEFTLNVLECYPGIDLGIGMDCEFDGSNLDKTYRKLQESKNIFIPISNIPSHGVTAECNRTGLSAEVYEDTSYISYSSFSKLKNAKAGNNKMQDILKKNNLGDKYCFTDELDKLGHKKNEDSHIAFVAIDGNSMSDRFMSQETLEKKKKLSITLRKAVEESFDDLLKIIDGEFSEIEKEINIESEKGKRILPLRPIVLGGDDVGFICHGSMGVYFAYKFLKFFENKKVSDGEPISACAGVAIAHAKYPIYRIQKIAEELLTNAKDKMKKDKNEGSYIDFQMFYSGISGELSEIRQNHYENNYGKMYMRPYNIDELEKLIEPLHDMSELAESKIKELRAILSKTTSERKNFLHHMSMRASTEASSDDLNKKSFLIPKSILGTDYSDDFYNGQRTPYLDLIELIEILPDYIIKRGRLNG